MSCIHLAQDLCGVILENVNEHLVPKPSKNISTDSLYGVWGSYCVLVFCVVGLHALVCRYLIFEHFVPECGGSMFLRNLDAFLQIHATSQHRPKPMSELLSCSERVLLLGS
jgi:hypothetical protein